MIRLLHRRVAIALYVRPNDPAVGNIDVAETLSGSNFLLRHQVLN